MKHSLNSEDLRVTSETIRDRGERQLWARIILSCYYGAVAGNLACRNFFTGSHYSTLAALLGLDADSIRNAALNGIADANTKRTYTSIAGRKVDADS